MKRPAYESSLPEGYVQIRHINAKDVKIGLIFNIIAVVTLAIVMAIAFVPLCLRDGVSYELGSWELPLLLLAFSAALILYVVLHELVHGAVYKALTHQKLTFGMS
jgi:fatty acid desaturase